MDVSDLIRRARLEASLSQRDLARRAGTSQSALARYEGEQSQPSLTTLERILRAADKTLRLELDDASSPPEGPVRRRLESRLQHVRTILEDHGVTAVSVFGSTSRGKDADDSDLDLLVELPGATYVKLASLCGSYPLVSPRSTDQRLEDILDATRTIDDHQARGQALRLSPEEPLLVDAVVRHLAVIEHQIGTMPPCQRTGWPTLES